MNYEWVSIQKVKMQLLFKLKWIFQLLEKVIALGNFTQMV